MKQLEENTSIFNFTGLTFSELSLPMRLSFNITSLCLSTVVVSSAFAQTIPNAGSLLQQIEHGQEQQLLPRKKPADLLAPPPEMKAPKGLSVTVREFIFTGNARLPADKLAPAVAPFLNHPLDFNGLNKAANAVVEAYHQAGWIVRAYLPAQDIVNGIVTLHIVEAVFGGAHINGEVPSHIRSEQILRIFENQQKIGQPLNADALDRALLLADDLPGVTVAGSLREGAKERETDVDLKLGDEPLATGDVGLDNTGARSTGNDRLTANLNLNSPFKQGDLIAANVIHTQGSDYIRLDGNVPLGSNGWRTGINTSHLSYNLVAPEFSALNASGTSDTIGVESTFPLIRSRLKNLNLNVNIDNKTFNNLSSGATTTHYKVDALTLGFDGNFFDTLWGGGVNSANLTLVDGNLNLNGSPNQTADASTTQAAGHYDKLRYAASRQQVITETVSLYGVLSGQLASKNLDSSEKFYLGGATGVRAYPANEGGGSEGQLLNLELRLRLPNSFNFTEFYDYGHVTINTNNNFTGATALNEYSLKGVGMSLAWQSAQGPSVKAVYSHRLGNNPNSMVNGNDQDGSLFKNRLWLTASFPFSGGGGGAGSMATSSSDIPVSHATEIAGSVTPSLKVAPIPSKNVTHVPLTLPASQIEAKNELPSRVVPSETPKTVAATDNTSVLVSLDRPASKQLAGLIKVSVPNEIHSFSFQLPAEVANSKAIHVHSGITGKWMPSWLKFNKKTKAFTATAVPKDALPTQIVVTTDSLSSTLVISERTQQIQIKE